MPTYSVLNRVNPKLYKNLSFVSKENLLSHFNSLNIVSTFNPRYLLVEPRKYLPRLFKRNDLIATQDVSMGRWLKTSTHIGTRKCWNCTKEFETSKIFCNHCGSLQSVDSNYNFFDIFKLKPEYGLDLAYIKQKYRELQTSLHPDKFSAKSKKEQELSEEFSSMVNKAYTTLLNPLERGLYILSLNNISIEEGSTEVDKEFLMEIMERNEEIENETDPETLNKFFTTNREKLDVLIKQIAEAFNSKDVELAKKLITEMKYYNSIDSKIKEIKQRLNIPD